MLTHMTHTMHSQMSQKVTCQWHQIQYLLLDLCRCGREEEEEEEEKEEEEEEEEEEQEEEVEEETQDKG